MRIITDQAADIFAEEARLMDIDILPIRVSFSDGPFDYQNPEDIARFYTKQSKDSLGASTSAPSLGDLLTICRKAMEHGEEVLYLSMFASFTSVGNFQQLISEMGESEQFLLVNTHQVAIGQRMLVQQAVHWRDEGKSLREIADGILALRDHVKLYGALEQIDQLRQGGRFARGMVLLGHMLNIKPVLLIAGGSFSLLGKARGTQAAEERVLSELRRDLEAEKIDVNLPISLMYASDSDRAQQFYRKVQALLPDHALSIHEIGPVVGTHTGSGVMGISYFMKDSFASE